MSKFVKLSEEAYKFEGKLSLSSAIPLGLLAEPAVLSAVPVLNSCRLF